MSTVISVLTTPPVAQGGDGVRDLFTVVVIDEPGGSESWHFVDYGRHGSDPVIYACGSEAEAMSLFREADSGYHRAGCECPDCFDPAAQRRRFVPARAREWQ